MNGAIAWYQSRALWAGVAAVIVAALTHFHVVLPASITQDSITSFLLQSAPVVWGMVERITASKVVVSTANKAEAINNAPGVVS